MKCELTGSIKRIGARIDVSGDVVNTLILEIYGPESEISGMNSLLKCPLLITLEEEDTVSVK